MIIGGQRLASVPRRGQKVDWLYPFEVLQSLALQMLKLSWFSPTAFAARLNKLAIYCRLNKLANYSN